MTLILVYTLSKTILGHSFFNYILVTPMSKSSSSFFIHRLAVAEEMAEILSPISQDNRTPLQSAFLACTISPQYKTLRLFLFSASATKTSPSRQDPPFPAIAPLEDHISALFCYASNSHHAYRVYETYCA